MGHNTWWDIQKERGEKKGKQGIWLNNGRKLPKLDERHEYKHPETKKTPRGSQRVLYVYIIIKFSKVSDKQNFLKTAKKEVTYH